MQHGTQTGDVDATAKRMDRSSQYDRLDRQSVIIGLVFALVLAILPAKQHLIATPDATSPIIESQSTLVTGISTPDWDWQAPQV